MASRLRTQPRAVARFVLGRSGSGWGAHSAATLGVLALLIAPAAYGQTPPSEPPVEEPSAPPFEPPSAAPPRAPSAAPARSPAVAVPIGVDTVAVRFSAPEMGGVDHPRFIFTRVLAFEARLEALADGSFHPSDMAPYTETHVQNALERHIAETILEGLDVSPALSAADIQERVKSARVALALRAGGAQALEHAAELEGLEPYEVLRIVQRQARASLYLDRMVAPMLEPSDPELRGIHQSGRTPFSKQPYEQVEVALRRWYIARRLREAVLNYYEGSRFRVQISVIGE